MDIVDHAIAGAAVGEAFGHPILGAAFAIVPDITLSIKRVDHPPELYNLTHSLAFATIVGALAGFALWSPVPLLALLSHLLLDLPTHGPRWAPPLLYPWKGRRFSYGAEWEWFNGSWWIGFGLTLVWSATWLAVSFA